MLNMTVIGAGAAGNKAVAELIAAGYPAENCAMINSTNKDVPEEYKQKTILFGTNRMGGCGKERSIGKKMLLEDLSQGQLDLDSYVPTNNAHAVVIVGSCEGGSGSASIPILAKYYKEVYELPVILVLFFGFKDDVRGIQNTIEIVQELSEDYTIIGIDNNKFMSSVNNNRFKAEKAANKKFSEIMKILIGCIIIPGEQVIDDTDLFKIVTTPGYMVAD